MTKSSPEQRVSNDIPRSPEIIGRLSKRLMEKAGSGTSRVQFLTDAVEMLAQYSYCDALRLVLRDRGRYYRCEAFVDNGGTYESTVHLLQATSEDGVSWCADDIPVLEGLCRSIFNMHFDRNGKGFTRHGSYCTGDLRTSGLPGDGGENVDVTCSCSRIKDECRSLAIVPIDSGQDRIGLIQLGCGRTDAFSLEQIESFERFGQTLGIALEQRRLQVALRERVKELSCLYGIAKLVAQPGISIEDILRGTVQLLPPAWLYPEVTVGRITVDSEIYETSGLEKAMQILKADIVVDGQTRGCIQVGYIEECPELDEGPFLSEERNLIDTIARDISLIVEQKQDEAEKAVLQEQLRHADRLATIGQLAAGVAHELNEPLASILGFAQLSAKEVDLPAQTGQDLQRIVSASLHAREIIRKLLVFAREATPVQVEVDLSEVIEDGLYFLDSRCKKAGISLVRNLSSSLPLVTADRSQMLQVLTNLVVNAIQAMPDGGGLTIVTQPGTKHVELRVEDNGVGMTANVAKRIFNPFFTTKAVDQGTGLGLSVVHGIVTAHGGTISVKSTIGRGTVFTILLPIAESVDRNSEAEQ